MFIHDGGFRIAATALLVCLALAGCEKTRYVTLESPDPPVSGPPPAPPPPPPPPPPPVTPPSSIEDSLGRLGVETFKTARLSDDGRPLPEDFSPFGHRLKVSINAAGETHFGAPLELVVAGFSLEGSTDPFVVLDNLSMPASGTFIEPEAIYTLNGAQAPWAVETDGLEEDPPVTLRDAAGGDLDGDGYDELLVAHADAGAVVVRAVNLANRALAPEVLQVPLPAEVLPVGDIRIRAADLDGNGRTELIVGVSQAAAANRPTRSALLILERSAGSLVVRHSRSFQSTLASQSGIHVTMVLEPGNIDYDIKEEIVLVLNEFVGTQAIPDQAATRFFVLDDATNSFAERLADTLSVVTSSDTYLAQVADVAIGDIDDDLVGEIVFGGLADLTVARSCNRDGNGNRGSLRYLLLSYEYNGTGINRTRTAFSSDADADVLYPGYCQGSPAQRALRFLDVNVLLFDNDRVADIQANQFIFSDFPQHGASWAQRATFTLPQSLLMPDENTTLVFDRNSADIIVQDVDGNGLKDFVTYRGGDDRIRIYSWRQEPSEPEDPPNPPELFQLAMLSVDTTTPGVGVISGRRLNPLLVTLDADGSNEGDVQTLQYVGYEFAFTEPLVLAAIAAPPCADDIGQNTDACTSAWGTAVAAGTEAEREITIKAGITGGFEAEYQAGAGFVVDASTKVFGLAIKRATERELGFHRSESYEVTRSVSFETGPMQDSVVFSSIPYDFYNYEVIASTLVTMDDIGADRELHRIGLPRTPVIRMAEIGYYNAHTTDTAVKIDADVFQHTPGQLDSYPDAARRDDILTAHRTQLDDIRLECPGCWQLDPDAPVRSGLNPLRVFDPVTALPGLVSESIGVGQGSGATQVAIDFSRTHNTGRSLETSTEIDVEFTIGTAVAGVVVGGGLAHTTTITHGESTSYVGTVGSIDAENFEREQYRFGMFTYLQGDPSSGQEFEVINYWVE